MAQIDFIGLCLFTVFANQSIAVLPKFDTPVKLAHDGVLGPHTAIIAFTKDYGTGTHWDVNHLNDTYDYVVIRHGLLTVSGKKEGTPVNLPAGLPHLKKNCCPAMWALDPDYLPANGFPASQGIVNIDHGTLAAGRGTYQAVITTWTIDTGGDPLTITANGYQTLVINPGAKISIQNVPLDFAKNPDEFEKHVPAGQHDFEAYYLLGMGSELCFKHLVDKDDANLCDIHALVTIDSECSNSQYP